MLTAVPTAAAAGAVPLFDIVGDPEPVAVDTPVMELYRRWRAYRDWLASPEVTSRPEEEFNALVDALDPMEAEMERLSAQNMTDLAAKVLCLTSDGEGGLVATGQGSFVAECKTLLARI